MIARCDACKQTDLSMPPTRVTTSWISLDTSKNIIAWPLFLKAGDMHRVSIQITSVWCRPSRKVPWKLFLARKASRLPHWCAHCGFLRRARVRSTGLHRSATSEVRFTKNRCRSLLSACTSWLGAGDVISERCVASWYLSQNQCLGVIALSCQQHASRKEACCFISKMPVFRRAPPRPFVMLDSVFRWPRSTASTELCLEFYMWQKHFTDHEIYVIALCNYQTRRQKDNLGGRKLPNANKQLVLYVRDNFCSKVQKLQCKILGSQRCHSFSWLRPCHNAV